MRGAHNPYHPSEQKMRSTPILERVYSTRMRRLGNSQTVGAQMPAQRAAARMFAVNIALGTLAVASLLVVVTRLVETWRIGSARAPDAVSVFGQRLSYPAANAGAIVVAVLAGFGLIVLITAIRAAVRELRADAAFRRAMARQMPASVQGALVIDDDRPQAFCAGLLHPQVYVSRGALEILGAAELAAILAHERHHARRRDPLRLACTRVLADALFFVPPLRHLIRQQQSLAEIGADEAAVAAAGGERAALASAMLTFSEESGDGAAGLAPERVDYLVGERLRWRFPLALVLIVCFCLAALVTLAVLAAETARGSATLAPPLVSAQPCIVMLALVPAGVALIGLLCVRTRSRPTRFLVRPSTARS
jgi:Zn-dependent protease with chaperone function